MRPAARWVAAFAVLSLAVAQWFGPDLKSPPADPARSLWKDQRVDARVAAVLRRSCADCHSHETAWPWYAKFSPVAWWLDGHVRKGREKLNLSDWQGASPDQLEEIYDSVAKKKMPTASYLVMHPDAKLSTEDQALLEAWVSGRLDAPQSAALAPAR